MAIEQDLANGRICRFATQKFADCLKFINWNRTLEKQADRPLELLSGFGHEKYFCRASSGTPDAYRAKRWTLNQ
ncbi:MAG: hypothetical protein ACM3VW_00990 [Bacteroidota bacterium]